MTGNGATGSLAALIAGGPALFGVFLTLARRMHVGEVDALLSGLRRR